MGSIFTGSVPTDPKAVLVPGLGALHPNFFSTFRRGRVGLMFRLYYDPTISYSTEVTDNSFGFISTVRLDWSFWVGSWLMSMFGLSIVPDVIVESQERMTFQEFSIIAKKLGSKTFISPEQSE